MKSLFIVLLVFVFSQTLSAQNKDYKPQQDSVLHISNAQKFPIFYVRNRFVDERNHIIRPSEITRLFKDDRTTRITLSNGRFCKTVATLMGTAGGFAVGWELGSFIATKELNEATLGIGAGLIAIGALFEVVGNKQIRKAVSRYNAQHNYTSYRLQFDSTPNGIGLTLRW